MSSDKIGYSIAKVTDIKLFPITTDDDSDIILSGTKFSDSYCGRIEITMVDEVTEKSCISSYCLPKHREEYMSDMRVLLYGVFNTVLEVGDFIIRHGFSTNVGIIGKDGSLKTFTSGNPWSSQCETPIPIDWDAHFVTTRS